MPPGLLGILDSVGTIDSWHPGIEYGPAVEMRLRPNNSEGTWWPVGSRTVPLSSLKWILAQSARWHARQAIELFMSEDLNELLQAAVSTGTSVELLAKAYLVTISRSLIADKGDRDTLLILAGHSSKVGMGSQHMKTIGAFDLLRMTKHLHKDLPWIQQDPAILRVRNAATHMALVERDELQTAILQMCRIVESLLVPLDLDRQDFWGKYAVPAVETLLDEAKTRRVQAVEAKKSAAAARLARLMAGLSEPSRQAVLAALSGRPASAMEHEEPQTCPVCGQQGWLICGVERGAIEADDEALWAERTAIPYFFECPVCQLYVDPDELNEFDFPREIDLEPEDISPEYEP